MFCFCPRRIFVRFVDVAGNVCMLTARSSMLLKVRTMVGAACSFPRALCGEPRRRGYFSWVLTMKLLNCPDFWFFPVLLPKIRVQHVEKRFCFHRTGKLGTDAKKDLQAEWMPDPEAYNSDDGDYSNKYLHL